MPLIPLLSAALVLSACAAPGPATTGMMDASNDLCLASTWQGRFVGASEQQANFEVGPLVREGKAQIIRAGERGAGGNRPDRLTFELGRDGRVARIYCG